MTAFPPRAWSVLVLVGGVLLCAGGLAELRVDESAPLSQAVQTSALVVHLALNLAGYALVLLGLPALALRLARSRPVVATSASILLAVGLLFIVAFTTFTVFVGPSIAARDPALLDGEWTGSMAALGMGFPIFFLSMVAFAGVSLWLGTLPRPAAGLLLGAVVLGAAQLPLDGAVLGGAAFAWMGYDAVRAPLPLRQS